MIASGQDAETKKAEAKQLLQEFCTGEDIERWVATRRFMHEFSFGNQILLEMQLHARLAGHDPVDCGFEQPMPVQAAWRWRKSGFWPCKTELLPEPLQGALWVWAPMTKKKDQDGTWKCGRCGARASGPRCPSGHRRQSVFVLKPVFSRLQVVNEQGEQPPLPPAGEPLEGDTHGHLWSRWRSGRCARTTCRSRRYRRQDTDAHLERGADGYYDRENFQIVVAESNRNREVATLVHELAHACGIHYDNYTRSQAEAIVESAAYLACSALGLDIGARSLAYVAGWAGADGEEPWLVVQGHLRVIDELARRLERAATPQPEEAAA